MSTSDDTQFPTRTTGRKPAVLQAGEKFGLLTVLRFAGRKIRQSRSGPRTDYFWLCACACGSQVEVRTGNLKNHITGSCGCIARDRIGNWSRTHGLSDSPEYRAWCSMIRRCESPKATLYANYGGRGIRVSPVWRKSFEKFLGDVGSRPSPQHSLDRIDVNGDYAPGNTRWVAGKVQQRNRTNNRCLTYGGETMCVAEWAERLGLRYATLLSRLNAGWPLDRALTSPKLPHYRITRVVPHDESALIPGYGTLISDQDRELTRGLQAILPWVRRLTAGERKTLVEMFCAECGNERNYETHDGCTFTTCKSGSPPRRLECPRRPT